ncbi:MAG TPA: helix-turn-helix domain-containing protein [Pyrinomonadaceae bacterium]|jgi:hypothetical protein
MADLTIREVAARFGVGPAAVRYWCRRRLFPSAYELKTQRGPVWRIPEAELDGFQPPKKTGRPRKLKDAHAPAPAPRKEAA